MDTNVVNRDHRRQPKLDVKKNGLDLVVVTCRSLSNRGRPVVWRGWGIKVSRLESRRPTDESRGPRGHSRSRGESPDLRPRYPQKDV